MTLSTPSRLLPPPRGHFVRRIFDEVRAPSAAAFIERAGDDARRTFTFRPARDRADPSLASHFELQRDVALAPDDGRRSDLARSSSWYLAGLIAQERPDVRLHMAQHQAAARVYRHANALDQHVVSPNHRDIKI
ncbi:MAG: hypothetical protein R3D05_18295 [Dongiaceae bacterium]